MKKVPAIKRLTKLESFSTVQLLGYADIAHSSMNELMNRGRDLYNCQYLGHISAEENRKNLDSMQADLNQYASAHNEIVVEIGNRFKKDLKLDKAPIQITAAFEKLKKEIPALANNTSDQLQRLAQEKAVKAQADLEKQREDKANAEPQPSPKEGKIAKKKPAKMKAVKK